MSVLNSGRNFRAWRGLCTINDVLHREFVRHGVVVNLQFVVGQQRALPLASIVRSIRRNTRRAGFPLYQRLELKYFRPQAHALSLALMAPHELTSSTRWAAMASTALCEDSTWWAISRDKSAAGRRSLHDFAEHRPESARNKEAMRSTSQPSARPAQVEFSLQRRMLPRDAETTQAVAKSQIGGAGG
jgi:hypothetical protein